MRLSVKHKLAQMAIGTLVIGLTATVNIEHPGFVEPLIERLDQLLYDARLNLTLQRQPTPFPIVIAAIDEKSLQQEGRWPWPRTKVAQLIQALRAQGATVTALDIVFAEPELGPLSQLLEQLPKTQLNDVSFVHKLQRLAGKTPDEQLAEALHSQDTVLGYVLHQDAHFHVGQLPKPDRVLAHSESLNLSLPSLLGYTANIPQLQEAAGIAGFITTFPDDDGVIRRTPLLLRFQDNLYASLALQAVKQYLLIDDFTLALFSHNQQQRLEALVLGKLKIHTDPVGQILIPYQGTAQTFPHLSATDIMHGKTPSGALQNALVFVGVTAQGLTDIRVTPVSPVFPGVEVHANVAAGIVNGSIPYQPAWAALAELLLIVGAGGILMLALPFCNAIAAIILVLSCLAALIGLDISLWKHQLALSITMPLLLIILQLANHLIYNLIFTSRHLSSLRRMFGQYVPAAHIEKMSEDPAAYSLEGEAREMTVLFADIRNFTTISEGLTPTDLKRFLNNYLTPLTAIIFNHSGTIDKYVGDMIMAFWGAPLSDKAHAEHGISAALAMQQTILELNQRFASQNLPKIAIGIGLNTGTMNVGDMGSEYRRAYTVLGDAVNLGSRLESLTKHYGVKILVGETTYQQQTAFLCQHIDRVKVKGKHEAIDIYEPLCYQQEASPILLQEIAEHQQALQAYFQQNWQQALALFQQLQQRYPERKLYPLFIERIQSFSDQPLNPDWDGAYVFHEK